MIRYAVMDTRHLEELAKADATYVAYLELRKEYADAPSFYLDCAGFFHDAGHLYRLIFATKVRDIAAEGRQDPASSLR